MRGSRPWPGMPGKHGLKPNPEKPLVYFYGTRNVAFISTKDLQDFTKEKKDYLLKKRDRFKDPDFVRAIDEIVQDFISCWWRALTTIILAVLPVKKSFGFVTASAPFFVKLSDRRSRRTPGVKVHICAIVESALRDLVSDDLQKIKQSTTDDSQMILASKTYDAIWEYDGLHVDSYSSASESEELLLEMERLLYEDLREELTRRGSCGGFGSSPTQASPFGSTFQHTQSAFGSNLFGSSSTPAFGSASTPAFGSATAPTFGATTTPSFGSTSTPTFWSTTPLYGGGTGAGFGFSSTPSFGSYVTPAFGSLSPLFESSATPAFGTSTRAFGSSTTPTATATFGSPGIGQMAFGGQQVGSRVAPYTTTPETDLCTGSRTAGKLESISAMCGYKDKSVEELRWEDYQRGDKEQCFFIL